MDEDVSSALRCGRGSAGSPCSTSVASGLALSCCRVPFLTCFYPPRRRSSEGLRAIGLASVLSRVQRRLRRFKNKNTGLLSITAALSLPRWGQIAWRGGEHTYSRSGAAGNSQVEA